MREILFRGKRIYNGEWVEGYYGAYYKDGVKIFTISQTTLDGEADYHVIPQTVGQYTGLKDKNGTRIFESDVIRIEFQQDFYIGEIYWADDFLGWVVKFLDGTTPETMELINFYNTKYVEVIGNIFDNSLEELQNGD